MGDISEANEQLKGEIDFLKGLSIEYKEEKECLEAALNQVSKELAQLKDDFAREKEENAKKIRGINQVNT